MLDHLLGYASDPLLNGPKASLIQKITGMADDESNKIFPVLSVTVEFRGIFKPAKSFQKLPRFLLNPEYLLGG